MLFSGGEPFVLDQQSAGLTILFVYGHQPCPGIPALLFNMCNERASGIFSSSLCHEASFGWNGKRTCKGLLERIPHRLLTEALPGRGPNAYIPYLMDKH